MINYFLHCIGVGVQFLCLGIAIILMAILGLFNVHRYITINNY